MKLNFGKRKIFTIFTIFLLILNIFVASFIFLDVQIIKAPKADVEIKILDINQDELVMQVEMRMHNPNSFDVSIEDFKVQSETKNGDKIGEINIKGGNILSDNSKTFSTTEKLRFGEDSDFKKLYNKITGKIGVKFLGFIKKTIPLELNVIVSLEEIIDNIQIPEIGLEFDLNNLNEDGLEFIAGVNVYNPNNIGISINKLNLNAFNDLNENVGSFEIIGGEIKPKNQSFFKSSGVLLYKFIDTKELVLSLEGDASIKIAGMDKSLSLSTQMAVILPEIEDFIFQDENIKFYIPVQFKLTLKGIVTTVGFKYYNPSNVSLIARNINCSIHRVDGETKSELGKKQMEPCIIDPHEEVCIKTEILIPYLDYLKIGKWRLIPNWIVLTIEGDFAIAGTRQAIPLSLNAYVNPNLFKNQEFTE